MSGRLIAGVGQLKPQVRLGQAVSEFGAVLEGSQKTLFNTLKAGSQPSPQDVLRLAEDINKQGQKIHGAWKPHGTRFQALLGQIQTLAIVGDTVIGGAQNLVASGVWASVRMSLLFTATYLSLFEKISTKLVRVGRIASIHGDLVRLYPYDDSLRDMVFEYLIIIVDLCRQFVEFTQENSVSRYLRAFDMDKHLQDSEDKLVVWAKLINDQAQYLHSQLSVKLDEKLTLVQKSQEIWNLEGKKARDEARCLELLKYLSPNQNDIDRAWTRERQRGTVNWIYESDAYLAWTNPKSSMGSLLAVQGSIGCGKSVVLSNITSHLAQTKNTIMACFFCQRSRPNSLDPDIVLRSLTHQIVRWIMHQTRSTFLAAFSAMLTRAVDAEILGRVVAAAISEALRVGIGTFYVVLDGLDDCQPQDVERLIETLADWRTKTNCDLRVCVSARSGFPLTTILKDAWRRDAFHLKVTSQSCASELQAYVSVELQSRPSFRRLSEVTQTLIIEYVSQYADGMYLWATLQIDYLFPRLSGAMPSDLDILSLLKHHPDPLYDVFDLAVAKAKDSKYQPRLFQIVVGSLRRMKISELAIALGVPAEQSQWNLDRIPQFEDAAAWIYTCSGGLLEVDEEDDTVDFVHGSVYYYFTDQERTKEVHPIKMVGQYRPDICDRIMGGMCLIYLDLPFHQRQVVRYNSNHVSDAQILAAVQKHTAESSPVLKLARQAMRWRGRKSGLASSGTSVDLLKVAEHYLEDQKRLREVGAAKIIEPLILMDYISEYWLHHLDHFLFDIPDQFSDDSFAAPFKKIIEGRTKAQVKFPFSVSLPFLPDLRPGEFLSSYSITRRWDEGANVIEWAVENDHLRLFWTAVHKLHSPRDRAGELHGLERIAEKGFTYLKSELSKQVRKRISLPLERYRNIIHLPFFLLDGDSNNQAPTFDVLALLDVVSTKNELIYPMTSEHLWDAYLQSRTAHSPQTQRLLGLILCLFREADATPNPTDQFRSDEYLRETSPTKALPLEDSSRQDYAAMQVIDCWWPLVRTNSIVHFRAILEKQWRSAKFLGLFRNDSDSAGSTIMHQEHFHEMLAVAKVPCHAKVHGITPFTAAISSSLWDEANRYVRLCHTCNWADHTYNALRLAISNCQASMVSARCRGLSGLNVSSIFPSGYRDSIDIFPNCDAEVYVSNVREIMDALIDAGVEFHVKWKETGPPLKAGRPFRIGKTREIATLWDIHTLPTQNRSSASSP